MAEVEWRKLRSDQLRDMARRDAMVILPIGAIEQHGPHLPVEVDSQLGEQVALRTARLLAARGEPVLVLPMLWTGVSEHHMSFGGTITLDMATFSAVVEGIVKSVVRHGFRRVVLLNGHGGNENALRVLADELTPSTMELSGCDAVFILPQADLKRAAKSIASATPSLPN